MKEKKKVSLKAIKIGLLGDSQVGKTAICRAFLKNDFDPDILSTIGNIKMETKYQLKNGETIKLILWDSAGQERFRSVAMSTLKAVKGIILVFDMTLEESFKSVSTWIKQIDENLNNPYLILFGNKIDIDKSEWKVNQEEIKKFVEEKKMPYFETSAKDNQGIKEGFDYFSSFFSSIQNIQIFFPQFPLSFLYFHPLFELQYFSLPLFVHEFFHKLHLLNNQILL